VNHFEFDNEPPCSINNGECFGQVSDLRRPVLRGFNVGPEWSGCRRPSWEVTIFPLVSQFLRARRPKQGFKVWAVTYPRVKLADIRDSCSEWTGSVAPNLAATRDGRRMRACCQVTVGIYRAINNYSGPAIWFSFFNALKRSGYYMYHLLEHS
jgi:hypothetical protein